MIRVALLVMFAGLAGLAQPVAAADEDYSAAYTAAQKQVIEELLSFASWCGGSKLYLERDRAYESVLVFDPENYKAHKGLKHKQERDGSWTIPEKRERPRNYKPALLEKCQKRRAKLVGRFRDELFGLFEKHAKVVTHEDRDRAYRAILEIDPDDAVVRAILEEVHVDGEWILVETKSSREIRAAWNTSLSMAAKNAPETTRTEPTGAEAELGIDWTTRVDNGHVRILAMVDRKEVSAITMAGYVARELFKGALGDPALGLATGYTIYLVPDAVSKNAFIAKHPALAGSTAARSRGGAVLGDTNDVVRWDRMKDDRLEKTTRHTLTVFMEASFGLKREHGWAYEGLGQYLTRRLLETRSTGFIEKLDTKEDDESAGGKDAREPDWFERSLALLSGDEGRDISRLFVLQAEEMQPDDTMLAVSLAAFLLEGRPAQAPVVLSRIGQDNKSAQAFEELLGFDAKRLTARLIRWLEERS